MMRVLGLFEQLRQLGDVGRDPPPDDHFIDASVHAAAELRYSRLAHWN